MERQKTRLEQLLTPTVEAMGFDVWGIDYSSRGQRATLCLFIDSERGVDVDDCATVSNQIEAVLDVEEVLPRNLTIQVSSPGLDRVLFKPEQFKSYLGELIDVRLLWPKSGRSHLRGRLRFSDAEKFGIDFENEEFVVEFDQLRRARLVPSFS